MDMSILSISTIIILVYQLILKQQIMFNSETILCIIEWFLYLLHVPAAGSSKPNPGGF